MPRVIENHEQIIGAFRNVEIVSELVEKLPNGEFKNELDMDIILFGRSYRGKQVGPYNRLLEYQPGEIIVQENTWESSIFYILVEGRLEASITEQGNKRRKVPVEHGGELFCAQRGVLLRQGFGQAGEPGNVRQHHRRQKHSLLGHGLARQHRRRAP